MRVWTWLAVAAAVVVLALARSVAEFYTEVLWFGEMGQTAVFFKTLAARWLTFGAGAAVFFVLLYVNVRVARGISPRARLMFAPQMPEQVAQALAQVRAVVEPFFDRLLLLAALVLSIPAGLSLVPSWDRFLLALNAVPFGLADPQFGRDIGFFVFTLPALRVVADWLLGVLVVVTVLTAAVHVVDGAIHPWARLRGFAPHVKAHLSVLLGLIVLTKAFDYWLSVYELDFSPRGQVVGASFTDVRAQLPALWILIAIALVSAVILLVNIRFRGWKLPALALGIWIGASVLVGGVYPALVQQFRVEPNEISAESPYIERNIASTRRAFDIDKVDVRQFKADESLSATQVTANRRTLENVRLWDPNEIVQTYKQLQEIRPYYDFNDVDIDRYDIGGNREELLVSVREMNVGQLADTARTWVNEHLVYTHGYGVVVSPVNRADKNNLPLFVVRNLPPESDAPELEVTRPGVYFGEESFGYAVVKTGAKEFDFPMGDRNAYARYTGKAGVEVGGPLRRLAFALRFRSAKLLLSGYVRSDSRMLFNRAIKDRIDRLAPWLMLDSDPYVAIIGGRLVWIVDAYTVSDRYPYSQPYNGVNYIRNSVKVTIDAYDGTATLYGFDEDDPVLAAWRSVFPGLITDVSKMPEEVRAHLRYPEDLFRLQAEVYRTYHMGDPQVFYNKEDQWDIPGQAKGRSMQPFYVLLKVPGEEREDFLLMLPFTPRNKDNMVGWMAAKSDPEEYGQRVVFAFPKQRLVLGPEQIAARINQDPTISQQLSLWNQRGSQVLFGNLLVIPVQDSIVFVRPLYLQAEQTAIPQLTRVIVAFAERVAMEPTLDEALAKVFGLERAAERPEEATGAAGPATGDLEQARELYRRAIEAQRRGDWAEYGRLIGELGRVLDRLSRQSSEAATATPRR